MVQMDKQMSYLEMVKLSFLKLKCLVEKALNKHQLVKNPTLEQLIEIDAWAKFCFKRDRRRLMQTLIKLSFLF